MSGSDFDRDPALEWLDHVRPVGLVVAPSVLKNLGLEPTAQGPVHTAEVAELVDVDGDGPAISDPWAFVQTVLGWSADHVAGAPDGPDLDPGLEVHLPEHGITLRPTWAVRELGAGASPWQLLVSVEPPGVSLDERRGLDGWEAKPQQRFERLLRETGVFAGLTITDDAIRLTYAPRGETSGHMTFPIRPLAAVAGRPMLGGLKLLLGAYRLFNDADNRRLPALLAESREAQAAVSTRLSEQVLGALFELLRGFDAAERDLIRKLAADQPGHLYEGLLTVLMRLVFVLYAEDRDLLPSRADLDSARVYESSYSVRGLYSRLVEDAALNPDTMDERRGGWGRLLALFRLINAGHPTGFVQARRGKLFDPDSFPFLEGRATPDEAARVPEVSDGCLLRILEGLMTLAVKGGGRERLSYRTLDVEQIGSVYETVMGFEAALASGRSLAIKAGKNNRTPVFVDLDALAALKGKARIKHLKEEVGRALTATESRPVEAAGTTDDLSAALNRMVDPRGSPGQATIEPGTPILQPTDERRRSGSHYTPRSLTAPIVKSALEPAFTRIGPDAKPDEVLDLKVCDPAMGSGAFLVEACRALGERLVQAWSRWPELRPTIPADEDEELHARRLVAQRCLYGVDRNPRAVDLARLSLWLATLARDHEFTFLDHALKCGDSLVGLDLDQIIATHWDRAKPPMLVGRLVRQHIEQAEAGRARIRAHADDATEAELRPQLRAVDARLSVARTIGDGVVASFFAHVKPAKRIEQLVTFQKLILSQLGSREWEEAAEVRLALPTVSGSWGRPFHWRVEFPEVFSRENGGFDAIVGNPPFMGGRKITGAHGTPYLAWLLQSHDESHGNADLAAHFFRAAFNLIREGGCFGLIATNTIRQGDTRSSGLGRIIQEGGVVARARRRINWPGEAAVVVSVVHVDKGSIRAPDLDGNMVGRISSYLLNSDIEQSPVSLAENSGKCFQGIIVLGSGFTFDDDTYGKGVSASLADRDRLLEEGVKNAGRIKPYIGGEEVNNSPDQKHRRYVIDLSDLPMRYTGIDWMDLTKSERLNLESKGYVGPEYKNESANDWPELVEILFQYAEPERAKSKNKDVRAFSWWRFWRPRPELRAAISGMNEVLVTNCGAAPHLAFCKISANQIFAHSLAVCAMSDDGAFSVLQSRVHELWARFFSSSMKDDLRYAPSDCFRNFPFPIGWAESREIAAIGREYQNVRAAWMIAQAEGLTKTYNRFHARGGPAGVQAIRTLHAQMDCAVLRAYGWNDLAESATPEFIEQEADEGKTPKTRLDWPAEFKDEVLARLLALNAERAAKERAAGLMPTSEYDEDEDEDQDEADVTGALL